ncbi:flagellar protein FlaG [Treponema sp. OMZ 840]|uniref:flagellar protein FlaG n=1 Tax=Treponema sp. OMZ 840 TaxID=244313 RepID=UPI003D8B8ED0
MSITTNGIGNNPAMDSRTAYDYAAAVRGVQTTITNAEAGVNKPPVKKTEPKPVQNFSAKELRYNMNEQLDQVVVTVVDPSTDKIIKEIPSAEVQEMKIRVKNAIGSFIDETR